MGASAAGGATCEVIKKNSKTTMIFIVSDFKKWPGYGPNITGKLSNATHIIIIHTNKCPFIPHKEKRKKIICSLYSGNIEPFPLHVFLKALLPLTITASC
jgi:hypothetical protein